MNRYVNYEFWKNKRILLTGHTGFKGSWLSLWLQSMGALVYGVALKSKNSPAMFDVANVASGMKHHITDIRDLSALRNHIQTFNPQIIIHMAAQPLVRKSYKEPVETFEINVMGTVNVLEAARSGKDLSVIVNVTTDKCYDNREWPWGYREDDAMGGYDPYSSSKGCVELLSAAYRKSFFNKAGIAMATARAGNVIGGGDWSKDRLIPDIFRFLEKKQPVEIRNPNAIRPWQHVLEPLSGYLILAECLYEKSGISFAEGWNFGPNDEDAKTVEWMASKICNSWSETAGWTSQIGQHPHEANFLKLDISKSKQRLGWSPRWNLETALDCTVEWHNAWINGNDMRNMSLMQINNYNNL